MAENHPQHQQQQQDDTTTTTTTTTTNNNNNNDASKAESESVTLNSTNETNNSPTTTIPGLAGTAVSAALSFRSTLGAGTVALSDLVNENLVVVRTTATVSIGLLTLYGLVHTPFFFRYRTVAELPAAYFQRRRILRGRLVRCWLDRRRPRYRQHYSSSSTQMPEDPIITTVQYPLQCSIRHLSPFESLLLPTQWYERWMQSHPTVAIVGQRPDERDEELLCVEIAGLQSRPTLVNTNNNNNNNPRRPANNPSQASSSSLRDMIQLDPFAETIHDNSSSSSSSSSSRPVDTTGIDWLRRLTEERPVVSFQLLGRKVRVVDTNNNNTANKRRAPEWENDVDFASLAREQEEYALQHQVAIGRLSYHDSSTQWWWRWWSWYPSTDLAQSLVRHGRASPVTDDGLVSLGPPPVAPSSNHGHYHHLGDDHNHDDNHDVAEDSDGGTLPTYRLVDTSELVRHRQADVTYLDQLSEAEYQAASEQVGLWSDPEIQHVYADVVEEAEFRTHAPQWKKLWRWLRGG